jgi:LysM repeat protein
MSTATVGYGMHVPHLRLTRRGRTVLTFVISLPLVIAALFVIINGGGAIATNHSVAPLHYVTVQGGETLWQLAGEVAPKADPREVVADIVSVNQLSSSDLQAGQRLAIPAQYEK